MAFIFGGNTPWTYDELKRQREIANALAMDTSAPRNVGEGLNAIGNALAYRGITKKAAKEEARMRGEYDAKWNAAFGGYGGGSASYQGGGSPSGTWTPAPPPPSPVDVATQGADVAKKGGLSFGDAPKANPGVIGGGQEPLDFGAAVMTPQQMLIEGAKRRGLDPIDVATAISYETGGKFDPMLAGPTTQWGTHRGLIQFGEPQAQQHGVDFSNPDAAWRSQLNPENGAIWSYLDGAGVKPGMGLDQIYSGINAGSVGRMGASDANNGGAPGTVADKVAGMGPHRENAAKFLGGTWTPADGSAPTSGGSQGVAFADAGGGFPPGMDIGTLIGLASDPMASPQQQAVVNALIQQQMQMMDPAYQMQMEKDRLELDALKNPSEQQPEELTDRTALLKAAGVDPASPEGQHYLLTGKMPDPPDPGYTMIGPEDAKAMGLPAGVYQRSADGKITEVGGGGTTVNVGSGETAFDKKSGEEAATALSAIQDEGISAGTGIATLDAMEASMDDPSFYSGTAAGAVEAMRRAAVSFGISDPSSVTSMETFGSLAKGAALSAMGGSLGAGFSNADRDFVEKQVPTLGNTPEGNRGIIRIQKAILKRKQEMAELAAQYAAEREAEGKRFDKAGFQKRAKEFAEANPLFGDTPPASPGGSAEGGVPAGVDPADWEFMTPEERALFQ